MQDLVKYQDEVETPSAFQMRPRNLDEAMQFAKLMAESDLVPSSYKGKPGNVLVACQMGAELGMTPMRALRSIAVINGRGTVWGDDMLAMVLASPVCEYVNESESTDKQGVCKTKRKGCAEQVSTFTLEDAKRAGLLGKQGPWQQHTGRMLKLRARGFGLRDTFADVLAGLVTVEEALDLPRIAEEPDEKAPATAPVTLKDRLKAKVDQTIEAPPDDVLEPTVEETLREMEPNEVTSPADPWLAKLRTAHTPQEVNTVYAAIPEELKQDCHTLYFDRLKALGKAKK